MSGFCTAVESIPGMPNDHCREGLQALKRVHRKVIRMDKHVTLTGSVDLDDALREQFPEEPRWDYGIGFRKGSREKAVWLEVHPAGNAKDVRAVLQKAQWLDDKLNHVPELREMSRRPYCWVASGKSTITKSTTARRLLAQNAHLVEGPVNRLDLP